MRVTRDGQPCIVPAVWISGRHDDALVKVRRKGGGVAWQRDDFLGSRQFSWRCA